MKYTDHKFHLAILKLFNIILSWHLPQCLEPRTDHPNPQKWRQIGDRQRDMRYASTVTLGKSSALSLTADSYISSVKTEQMSNWLFTKLPYDRPPPELTNKQTKTKAKSSHALLISKNLLTQFGMIFYYTNWWKAVLGEKHTQHYKIHVHKQVCVCG